MLALRRAAREQLDVIVGRAGALGDARHRRHLRDIAAVLGEIDDPFREHAAAFAAHGEDGDGDGAGRGDRRHVAHAAWSLRSMRRWKKPITAVAHRRLEAVPAGRIGDQRGAVERRAQHRGVADLAAQPAADAGVDHLGDRLAPQRIGIGRDRQRRAAGEPDAGMIAGAGVGIDAEALAHHALAALRGLAQQRPDAALLVQHAFRLRDDDLRAPSPWWSAPPAACRASWRRRRCGSGCAPIRRRRRAPPSRSNSGCRGWRAAGTRRGCPGRRSRPNSRCRR